MLNIIQNTIGALARKGLSVIRNGLKMWLPFESSGSDTSGNSNNATLYTGKALSFDGVNDYVDFGNTGVGLKTLAFWINLDSTTEKVLQLTSTQSVEVSSGTITLNGTWTGSTIYVDATATSTIAASNWKRVVITTTSAITVNDLELGRIGSSYGDFILSDLQIYDTAWTQDDVTFDYDNPQHLVTDNSDSTIALSNLKGYWHLSEGDGAINYDSSGEDNDGTIIGATWEDQQATIPQLGLMDWAKSTPVADEITLIADPNDPSKDILGNSVRLREHSLNLDGSGYAEVPDADNLDFGTGDFSYGFWFKVESGDLGFLFGVSSLGNPSGVALTMDVATGKIRSRPFGIAATYTTSGYNDGSWHYAFHNIDRSDSAKLFIDNTEVLSQDISSESSTSLATTNWYVGVENGTGTFLNGLIDDVTIYNRALSSDEVEQNYKAGLNKHKASSSFSDDFSSDYGF